MSNLFWDAPSILKSNPILFNGQDFKKSPENSIIFIKDGSNAGSFTYCDKNSYIATTCDYFCVKINPLYVYYFIKSKEKHIKNNLITGETIPHLYKKHLFSILINFVNDNNEQIKISKFFSLLDKHIELWERKLQLYLLKKSWFINFVWRNSPFSEVNFLELFDYYDIQNKNFEKYTIGKKGIIKMNTIKETTENGRAFYKNSIIFGLGINEIGVSIDKIGSCSPIYLTYKIIDSIYTKYFFYFSNYIFKEKENYFCKKSTRREKEISRKLLEKIKIKLIDFDSLWKMDILDFFTKEITFLDKQIILLKKQRKFYLNKLFI